MHYKWWSDFSSSHSIHIKYLIPECTKFDDSCHFRKTNVNKRFSSVVVNPITKKNQHFFLSRLWILQKIAWNMESDLKISASVFSDRLFEVFNCDLATFCNKNRVFGGGWLNHFEFSSQMTKLDNYRLILGFMTSSSIYLLFMANYIEAFVFASGGNRL